MLCVNLKLVSAKQKFQNWCKFMRRHRSVGTHAPWVGVRNVKPANCPIVRASLLFFSRSETETHGSAFSLNLASHSSSPTSPMPLTFSQILSSFSSTNPNGSRFANLEARWPHQHWHHNHMMAWLYFFKPLFGICLPYYYMLKFTHEMRGVFVFWRKEKSEKLREMKC